MARRDPGERGQPSSVPRAIWNIERGLELSSLDVVRAQTAGAALFHRLREFLERHDCLVLPVSQGLPVGMQIVGRHLREL